MKNVFSSEMDSPDSGVIYTAFQLKTGEIQQIANRLVHTRLTTKNNQTWVAGALSKRSPRIVELPWASAEAERPRHPRVTFQYTTGKPVPNWNRG